MSKNFLSMSFSPTQKFLISNWLRPVNSQEYRHGIRLIALSINALQAKYSLTDFSKIGTPPLEDQLCTANFLKKALKNTSLERCARIVTADEAQLQAYQRVMQNSNGFPYLTSGFTCTEEAHKWLFENNVPLPLVTIPVCDINLDTNTQILRNYIQKCSISEQATERISDEDAELDRATAPAILCQTDLVRISVDFCNSLIALRWLQPVSSNDYKYGIQKLSQLLKKYKLTRLMINNQQLGVMALTDQSWLSQKMSEIVADNIPRLIAIVSSKNSLQQLVNDTVDKKIRQSGGEYEPNYFFSEDEAIEWLLMQKDLCLDKK